MGILRQRQTLVRILLACAFFSFILASAIVAVRGANSGKIRVGLFYGSGALPTANLANEVGSGYEFGYFKDSNSFVSLGQTSEEKITICKDTNLYLAGGTYYETPLSSGYSLVGAYHLQLSDSYATYAEAYEVAQNYPYGFPAYINGTYVVRFEFYSTAANAMADGANYPGTTVVGASTTCYTITQTSTGRILFELDMEGAECLGVMPVSKGQETQTWFKGYQYYGGFQYNRRSGNDLTVVNIVDEDRYIAGVLPNEFVSSGGIESLKAGCIAIRTYARSSSKHATFGFDVCNSTDCQVYRGVYTGENADKVLQAATETSGKCLYYNGKLIEALYFASDGGATESAVNAWGVEHPYLVGKEDPYEKLISFPSQSWEYIVTPEQVKKMLSDYGYICKTVVKMEVTEMTPSGNVNALTITDSNGEIYTFTNDDVRCLQTISGITYMSRHFSITPVGGTVSQPNSGEGFTVSDGKQTITKDSVYAITANGKQQISENTSVLTEDGLQSTSGDRTESISGSSEGWIIRGGGYGHNVGMSQWGAYAMAEQGYSCEEILKFYYTGVTIN